jgi:hypothetical protein
MYLFNSVTVSSVFSTISSDTELASRSEKSSTIFISKASAAYNLSRIGQTDINLF